MQFRTDSFRAAHCHVDYFGVWLPRIPQGQHPLCCQDKIHFADRDLFYDFLAPRCIEAHDSRERSSLPYEFTTKTRIRNNTAHLEIIACKGGPDPRAASIAMRTREGWLITLCLDWKIQFVLFVNNIGGQTLWMYNEHWVNLHVNDLLQSCGHNATELLQYS